MIPQEFTINNFFDRLEQSFADPNAREKAQNDLNLHYQRGKPFTEWIREVDSLLLESGADSWPDEAMINVLNRLINQNLKSAIVSVVNRPRKYREYASTLAKVAENLNRVKQSQYQTQPAA